MGVRSFRELEVWKDGIKLVKRVYEITDQFPKTEVYGLISQIRRSAVSVPSNIAEGFKRRHHKEFKQFLNVVLGSLAELETQFVIARQLCYINSEIEDEVVGKIDRASWMVATLHSRL